MSYLETSAKTGENIEEVFHKSAKMVLDEIGKGTYNFNFEASGIKLGNKILIDHKPKTIKLHKSNSFLTKRKQNCCTK